MAFHDSGLEKQRRYTILRFLRVVQCFALCSSSRPHIRTSLAFAILNLCQQVPKPLILLQ